MTSHPLGHGFENNDGEGTRPDSEYIVHSTLAEPNPNLNPNPNPNPNHSHNPNPKPNLNPK